MNWILGRVSYHLVYDASILDALGWAQKNGFSGVQVAVEAPHLSFETLSHIDTRKIVDYARANNLYICLHGPDDAASLFQHNRHLRQGVLDYYHAFFGFARAVGAKLATVHVGRPTEFRTATSPEATMPPEDVPPYHDALNLNLKRLVEIARGGPKVCVENHRLDSMTLDALMPHLERGSLFLCWDIAKSFGREDVERFFLDHLEWVRQVHLHDVVPDVGGRLQSHKVIGSGCLDFRRYLGLLQGANVEDFCIEVRPRDKAKESLDELARIASERAGS